MHALIIEDEPLIAMLIEEVLGDCGFTSFDMVSSVQQAVRAATRHAPDLITADVDLRPGSGIDAVDSICDGPPIPVVFITGTPGELAKRMPNRPWIVKPFQTEELIKTVRLALEKGKENLMHFSKAARGLGYP